MNENKPLIAIVCHRGQGKAPGEVIPDELSPAYTSAIIKAGGLPLLIPNNFPLEDIKVLRRICAGLLLAGGGDVETCRYCGMEHPSVSQPCLERDELEIALTHLAFETHWPILGICRGIQVMNVAMGGTLFSDIADQVPNSLTHASPTGTPRNKLIHSVSLQPGSMIEKIIGASEVHVNTFHHQAVAEPAAAFSVSGNSEDGLIETIEHTEHPFALGVQWHPECLQEYPEHMRIFSAFVSACDGAHK